MFYYNNDVYISLPKMPWINTLIYGDYNCFLSSFKFWQYEKHIDYLFPQK